MEPNKYKITKNNWKEFAISTAKYALAALSGYLIFQIDKSPELFGGATFAVLTILKLYLVYVKPDSKTPY